MVDTSMECSLGAMLGKLTEMRKTDKWGFIVDKNGNVATFMKYKASYFDAYSNIASGSVLNKQRMAKWMIGALMNSNIGCLDLDSFSNTDGVKPETYLNPDWFPNIDDKKKFLVYENIAGLGKLYPLITEEIIGKHKVPYTLKESPSYFCFVAKTKEVPEAFKGKFTVLTVT